MGRLTIDIPDSTHHHLKVTAASRGITIRDYVLDKIVLDLDSQMLEGPSLSELAAAWEKSRDKFKLARGDCSFAEIIHENHKW